MAAICCKACMLPCKGCGHACTHAWSGFKKTVNHLVSPNDRPSPIFLSYTLVANAPIIIGGLVLAAASLLVHCHSHHKSSVTPTIWLLTSAALGAFFVFFALHLYDKFSKPYTQPFGYDQQPDNFTARAWYTICHDGWVFVYLLGVPLAFVWSIIGFNLHDTHCNSSIRTGAYSIALIMMIYILGNAFVLLLSACAESQRSARDQLQRGPNNDRDLDGALLNNDLPASELSRELPQPPLPYQVPAPQSIEPTPNATYPQMFQPKENARGNGVDTDDSAAMV